jgi:hypothetical protein
MSSYNAGLAFIPDDLLHWSDSSSSCSSLICKCSQLESSCHTTLGPSMYACMYVCVREVVYGREVPCMQVCHTSARAISFAVSLFPACGRQI